MLDAKLNLFDGHTPSLANVAAVLVNDVLKRLRNRRTAVHHEMAIGEPLVNLDDAIHGQRLAGWLACELVSTVAGAYRHRQGITACVRDKSLGFVRIGQ